MARSGGVYLYRRQPEVIAEPGCSGTIECALIGVADHMLLLLWLMLLVVVALGSLVFLPRARSLCDRERSRTQAEFDAFDAFIDQVHRITPAPPVTTAQVGTQAPLMQRRSEATGNLRTLVEAYESSVMSVPHFEEEYDETVADHMREELGDEIAQAVNTEAQLTKPLHQSVIDAAIAARDRRGHLLAMLDEEANSLGTLEIELRDMASGVDEATTPLCADLSFDELQELRRQLEVYEQQIESLVNQRQVDRTAGRSGAIRSGQSIDLQTYLYRTMEPTYPVLAEATQLLSRVQITHRRVEDELIYRG